MKTVQTRENGAHGRNDVQIHKKANKLHVSPVKTGENVRKPHEHDIDGDRINCSDPECRMPFKVTQKAPRARRVIRIKATEKIASREVQHARYLDCGPGAWDDC